MLTAHDVARYFLAISDEDAGDLISHLKLQKLCYYAQGFHLAIYEKPLFNERIEAWQHGPVVPDLWQGYAGYGAGSIEKPVNVDFASYSDEAKELMDEVYEVYGQFSAWKLRDMTHEEAPWADAWARGQNTEIGHESLRLFFETLVEG